MNHNLSVRHVAQLVLLGIVAGCAGVEPPAPAEIVLSPGSIEFMALGQTRQLLPTVRDENGATMQDVAVSWNSSSPEVATVSPEGLVTAVGAGSAEITATAGAARAAVPVRVTQTPTQMQKISGDAQTGTVGQPLPQPLVVELRDALGNTIAGASVSFTVTLGGGTLTSAGEITGADGRAATIYVLGSTAGINHQVSATSQTAAISAVFLATATAGPVAAVQIQAGNGQIAAPGTPVLTQPAVRATDAFGNPVSGVAVAFEVGAGGGSVTGADATTDVSGIARVGSWTLGSAGANTLIATVSGESVTGNPVTFTATAAVVVAYDIRVRFLSPATASQRQAFDEAEARWEGIVTRDLTNIPLNAPAGTCGDRSPAINETIDDVLILAVVEEIDGPRGTLAQAGPCYIRTAGQLPILGLMRFDAADLADIESVGALSDVILHEMGHVLGFGTVWHLQGLLAEPAQDGGPDPHFTGNQAIAAFDAVGGTDYTGNKVPVEDQGGPATADSHWRESVMGNELMTGFVSLNQPANNPLSLVTVASMADQGYLVNSSAADSYSLIVGLRAGPIGPRLQLGDDRLRVPFRLVDSAGRVVRIVRP